MIWDLSSFGLPNYPNSKFHHDVDLLALFYFLLAIGALVCNTIAKSMFSRVGEGLTYSLRHDIFKKIIHMPVHWFDLPDHSPGTLAVRLGTEAKMVNNLVSNVVDLEVGLFTTFATAIIIGFIFSWAITLIAMALSPLQIFSGILRSKFV
jgi:ATP-binding cassette subfamily B (MDR/TAP) protein 1